MNAAFRNHVTVAGQGARPLVFVHGFGTDQTAWRFVAPHFAGNFKLVLLDLVGFGQSDRLAYSDERHGSIDGYAADLIDVLVELGLDDVTLVGHSVGGMIGLLASIAQPARFQSLVLLNSSPRFIDAPPDYVGGLHRQDVAAMLEAMDRDYVAWARFLAPVAIGRGNDPEQIRDFGQVLTSLDPLITREFSRLTFYLDCRASLAEVSVPVSIIHSTEDEFAPAAVGRYLQSQLRGSSLFEIEASGHCPHLTHPELVTGVLRRILTAAAGPDRQVS
jgi:sigma-B regulation protein RsbQ